MEEEYALEDIDVGLLSTALPLALVSFSGFPSMLVFKLCHQDVTVEGSLPWLALLGEVLDTLMKDFFLHWQRIHRFQSPRASADLRI